MIMEFIHGNITIKINSLSKGLIEINFDLSKIDKVLKNEKVRCSDYWIESKYKDSK